MFKVIFQSSRAKRRFRVIALFAFLVLVCAFSSQKSIQRVIFHEIASEVEDISGRSLDVRQSVERSGIINNEGEIQKPITDRHTTIVIDPGHGGMDSGTEASGVYEKDINLDIALRLGKILKELGIEVVYTRQTDQFVSLRNRIKTANRSNGDLLISIHNNSLENDTSANGTTTLYYSRSKGEEKKMSGKRLAQLVQAEIVKGLNTRDRGIVYTKGYGMLEFVAMPSVIAEVGFISNDGERQLLMQEKYRQKAADALARALVLAIDEI